jgi:hypothetical protein
MSNLLVTFAVGVAIAGAPSQQTAPQHQAPNMPMMQSCPMKVTGADLAVADVDGGIAVTVTTKSGDVADLRRRTENMAKMHGDSSTGNMHGPMMSFSVKYEEVPNGARLTLTPKDLTQLEEFRTKVRQHVEQMKKGDCSMMQGMMSGMKGTEPTRNPAPEPQPNDADHGAHHPPGEAK